MYLNAQSHLVDAELISEIGPKHFIELPAESEDRMMNVWMGTKGKCVLIRKIRELII